MKRETKINRAKEKAKKTSCAMVGVDVKGLILTNEEKHKLINEGFHLATARHNQLILTYSQKARTNDLKEKVWKRINKKLEKQAQLEESKEIKKYLKEL